MKLQMAKQADGRAPLPEFNPDLTRGELVPKRGGEFLPARCGPAPAPIDSDEHYLPGLHTVQIGDVAVSIRDGRAARAKTDDNATIKIKAVPARPRSLAAAP